MGTGRALMGVTGLLRTPPGFLGVTELVAVEAVAKGAAAETVVAAVQRVAEAASDFSWLSRGDAVFIKPVGNSGNRYPATTSPPGGAGDGDSA